MIADTKQYLFTEKYRPTTIGECILPSDLTKTFSKFVEHGNFNNLLLSGDPGVGKTTVAIALCKEIGCDFYLINASNERGIDVLRTKLTDFTTTVSLEQNGKRKIIILDEADNLTPDIMSALRSFIEKYSDNAGFIFTCNYPSKIIDPLQSRLVHIPFNLNQEKAELMAKYVVRLIHILEKESIEFDQKALMLLVKMYFPDMRKILNEIQRYSIGGRIDTGIFANFQKADVDYIYGCLKEKNFRKVREYFDNYETTFNYDKLYRDMYDGVFAHVQKEYVMMAILIIDKYSKERVHCISQKINAVAMIASLLLEGVQMQ